ncbi:hypothetical protein [Nostoc sp. FACHB-190]|nr:hypothetical protein [Nostoc sp. FACHB-190]MBD2298565.1 hypothetical protein [Nostoc sp. FACHB-190]
MKTAVNTEMLKTTQKLFNIHTEFCAGGLELVFLKKIEPLTRSRDAQHWLSQPLIYLGVTSVSKNSRVEFAYFECIVIIAGFGAIALAYLGHCNYRWIWSDRTHSSKAL